MEKWKKIVFIIVGLLLMEAMIMLYAVPKANEDEISMRIRVFIDLALALFDKFGNPD